MNFGQARSQRVGEIKRGRWDAVSGKDAASHRD